MKASGVAFADRGLGLLTGRTAARMSAKQMIIERHTHGISNNAMAACGATLVPYQDSETVSVLEGVGASLSQSRGSPGAMASER